MSETLSNKGDVDWFLTAQYIISNSSSFDDFSHKLFILKPFVKMDELLKMVLVYIPLSLCRPQLVDLVYQLLNEPAESSIEYVDVSTIWEPSPVPKMLQLILGMSEEDKLESQSQTKDEIYCAYDWGSNTFDEEHEDLFSIFFSGLLLRMSELTSSFQITDPIALTLGNYENKRMKVWLDSCYYPLQNFNKYSTDCSLHDFAFRQYTLAEQMNMILDTFSESLDKEIILKTLIPYLNYIGIESCLLITNWCANIYDQREDKSSQSESIIQYRKLLELIRQDELLRVINSCEDETRLEFCSTIISTVLSIPNIFLEELAYSKEILTLLKGFDIPQSSDIVFPLFDVTGNFVNEASIPLINYILKAIETAEILSSNNLSLTDVINLENKGHDIQISELQKFINVKSAYIGSTLKSWSITLSSIYRTLKTTKKFQNVTIDELSELILVKLLDVKQFTIIQGEFLPNFNSLNSDKTKKIIITNAWQFYKSASSCDANRGGLKVALQNLSLLDSNDEDVRKMKTIIKANEMLMDWSIYFKSGVPVTPNDILTINDPFKIIQRILDLNDNAYKSIEKLYNLLTLLIIGLNCQNSDPIFKYITYDFNDLNNLLALDVKLLALQYSSTIDMELSYNLANEILDFAMNNETNSELDSLLNKNWIIFFTLTKFEFSDNIDDDDDENNSHLTLLKDRLRLLSKLLLFTPLEFNSQVLEYWQMLNSQYDHSIDEEDEGVTTNVNQTQSVNMGNIKNRLQRSLNTTADIDKSDIGRNIIGWIVGAN